MRTFPGVLANPRGALFIGRAGGDKRPVLIVVNLSKTQPPLIKRAVRMVFTLPANKVGTAFVHRTGSHHIATQCFTRTAGVLLIFPQIAGQKFYYFEVFFHGFLLYFRSLPFYPLTIQSSTVHFLQ